MENPKLGRSAGLLDESSPILPHFRLKNSPIDTFRPAQDLLRFRESLNIGKFKQ